VFQEVQAGRYHVSTVVNGSGSEGNKCFVNYSVYTLSCYHARRDYML